jgi:predicted O-methyltransferase YrrM
LNFLSLFKRNILYKIKKKINIDSHEVEKKELDELFYYYGSDKANIFKKTQAKGHGFSKFYSLHLNQLKDRKINILEIGSYAGASASAFAKYFTKSTIYCFDVNISKFKYFSEKIKVYGLDINNKDKLNKILNKIKIDNNLEFFDIIIDDGSHYLSDILISIKTFFKYLKKNGIYVIEDYKHPNYYAYNRNVKDILVDELLRNLSKNQFSNSNILNYDDQKYLLKEIKKINIYKGNLKDSDICFIEKN